jgi:hypothetical protein
MLLKVMLPEYESREEYHGEDEEGDNERCFPSLRYSL